MCVRNFDDSLSGSGGDLVILAETAGIVQPTEGALDDPMPGKFFPFVRLDFLCNINVAAQDFVGVEHKSTEIARIGAEFFEDGIALDSKFRRQNPRPRVV